METYTIPKIDLLSIEKVLPHKENDRILYKMEMLVDGVSIRTISSHTIGWRDTYRLMYIDPDSLKNTYIDVALERSNSEPNYMYERAFLVLHVAGKRYIPYSKNSGFYHIPLPKIKCGNNEVAIAEIDVPCNSPMVIEDIINQKQKENV